MRRKSTKRLPARDRLLMEAFSMAMQGDVDEVKKFIADWHANAQFDSHLEFANRGAWQLVKIATTEYQHPLFGFHDPSNRAQFLLWAGTVFGGKVDGAKPQQRKKKQLPTRSKRKPANRRQRERRPEGKPTKSQLVQFYAEIQSFYVEQLDNFKRKHGTRYGATKSADVATSKEMLRRFNVCIEPRRIRGAMRHVK